MVSVYITTMKASFLFKFWLLTNLFVKNKFISKQREAFLIDKFSWLICFCVSMLFSQINLNQYWLRKSSSLYWYNRLPLYMKHKVWPRLSCCTGYSYWVSAFLIQSPGDTVQTGTGKVDPVRKFKCTMASRVFLI